MLDATAHASAKSAAHQRARGEAWVRLAPAGLRDLRQRGSAKAMLPHVSGAPEIVFLNTAGGLTGGDQLSFALDLESGTRATATTQTAERAYRAVAGGPAARLDLRHSVGENGFLDWLPQETILFENSNLERRTRIDLAASAGCLFCETVILGRAAMGETLSQCRFTDRREVWRAGLPVLIEPFGFEQLRHSPATLPARAFATIALIAQGAEEALTRVRAALGHEGVTAAATAFDGKCIIRLTAADGLPLRRQMIALIRALRSGPMPRAWGQ